MLVIAADADHTTRQFFASTLQSTEFEPRICSRAKDAWDLAREEKRPAIVLFGWDDLDIPGPEMCRRLRGLRDSVERYAITTLGPGNGACAQDAVEAGADDVLVKPFCVDVLLSRLRVAASRCATGARKASSPADALREALASDIGGEVVIRRGKEVGRIYVVGGAIGWAGIPGRSLRLDAILNAIGLQLDAAARAAILEESRKSRMHFAEIAVQWGYLDPPSARECVRVHVAEQLTTLLSWEGAVAMFLPRARAFLSSLRFNPQELISDQSVWREPAKPDADRRTTSVRPSHDLRELEPLLRSAAQIDGTRATVILEGYSGAAAMGSGEQIDVQIAWSLLATLKALGSGSHESIAVQGSTAFVARTLPHGDAILIKLDLSATTLGLARVSLQRLLLEREHSLRSELPLRA
jgi:CheY-like chemotaxis protein